MATEQTVSTPVSLLGRVYGIVVTILLWIYFTLGFVVFFMVFYLAAWFFAHDRECAFQRLNSRFYQGFFWLVRLLIPRHHWLIDDKIRSIQSSIIVCNHLSYLDPLILIALFERHKTIVKSKFFHVPVFGLFVKTAGYLPSTSEGYFSRLMIEQVEKMDDFLASGGNLFIFPEGTRSRDGEIGSFNRGAFKIARLCKAPIKIIQIRNSETLFRPGKFLFNTAGRNTITVTLAGEIEPNYELNYPSASELESLVREVLVNAGNVKS